MSHLVKILLLWITIQSSWAGRPNIVIIMGDDWSWPHASILGDATVKTPHFDRIAKEGVYFENAFSPAPSCTPSRHAVASGQYHWRLKGGVNLGGSIPKETPVYPDLLAGQGYQTGFCRKGTAPSKLTDRGNDPFGKRFKNFDAFISERKANTPFCFWYGAGEPHRPYKWKASLDRSIDLDSIKVPPFLPDNRTTRIDLADYYHNVERLDQFAGQILATLEEIGELEDTVVIMTGDNGMPFPRAKATLYDSGTRVPLAIRWGKNIHPNRQISDFVSLPDLAPTILEICDLSVPKSITGRSLLPLLKSKKSGFIDPSRDYVLTGMEKHVYRNPSRAIRTTDFLYIRNHQPSEWPNGSIAGQNPKYDFLKTPWPTTPGAFSHNIDPSPTKQWMRLHPSTHQKQAFGERFPEELYDIKLDPQQLTNLLEQTPVAPSTETARERLSKRLTRLLKESADPHSR